MPNRIDQATSVLTSSLRLWGGTWGKLQSHTPAKLLELFDREDDAQCRLVREVLTELNLDAQIYPCPAGGERFAKKRQQLLEKHAKPEQTKQHAASAHDAQDAPALPMLYDPNHRKVLQGAAAIITYLLEHYLVQPLDLLTKLRLEPSTLNLLSASIANIPRGGIHAQASRLPRKKLVLYSFEASPFARLVRERLCALELPYQLINVGKLVWGEFGPAARRLSPGPYHPTPGSKRERFLKEYGKVQIPLLLDPNQDVAMFESAEIVRYLDEKYMQTA